MAFKPNASTVAAACEQGHTFEPSYPDGTPLGATITVRGVRSQAVRDHARRQYALAQEREVMARKRGREAPSLSLDEIDDAMTETAVVYTMGWSGFESDTGEPLDFTPDAVRNVYRAHPWLRERVIAEAQDLGNFIKASSKS